MPEEKNESPGRKEGDAEAGRRKNKEGVKKRARTKRKGTKESRQETADEEKRRSGKGPGGGKKDFSVGIASYD